MTPPLWNFSENSSILEEKGVPYTAPKHVLHTLIVDICDFWIVPLALAPPKPKDQLCMGCHHPLSRYLCIAAVKSHLNFESPELHQSFWGEKLSAHFPAAGWTVQALVLQILWGQTCFQYWRLPALLWLMTACLNLKLNDSISYSLHIVAISNQTKGKVIRTIMSKLVF